MLLNYTISLGRVDGTIVLFCNKSSREVILLALDLVALHGTSSMQVVVVQFPLIHVVMFDESPAVVYCVTMTSEENTIVYAIVARNASTLILILNMNI